MLKKKKVVNSKRECLCKLENKIPKFTMQKILEIGTFFDEPQKAVELMKAKLSADFIFIGSKTVGNLHRIMKKMKIKREKFGQPSPIYILTDEIEEEKKFAEEVDIPVGPWPTLTLDIYDEKPIFAKMLESTLAMRTITMKVAEL